MQGKITPGPSRHFAAADVCGDFLAEAHQCREQATMFAGLPEAKLLEQLASAFESLNRPSPFEGTPAPDFGARLSAKGQDPVEPVQRLLVLLQEALRIADREDLPLEIGARLDHLISTIDELQSC